MKKPIGIIIYGTTAIIIGSFSLIANIVLIFLGERPLATEPRPFLFIDVIMSGLFLVAGFGVLDLKEKFRKLALYLVIFVLFETLLKIMLILTNPVEPNPWMAIVPFLFPVIIFNLAILIYLNNPSIKEKFIQPQVQVEKEKVPERKRPIGITILSVLYFLSVLSIINIFNATYSYPLFGISIAGIGAKLILLINIALSIYIAIGFLKLKKVAWMVSIIYCIFGIMNFAISYFKIPFSLLKTSNSELISPLVFISTMMFLILITWYIYSQRKAFKN